MKDEHYINLGLALCLLEEICKLFLPHKYLDLISSSTWPFSQFVILHE